MKTLIAASLLTLTFAASAPMATAQGNDDGLRSAAPAERVYTLSRADAVDIARGKGMDRVKEVDRDDGKWELEGCTRDGREIEIDIHGQTGAILEYELDDHDDDC